MADEPMSDERLAEIRARAEAIRNWLLTPESDGTRHFPTSRRILGVDALALLAEVDLRRAREAAARAIAERMAEGVPIGSPAHCYYCNAAYDFEDSPSGVRLLEAPHKPDCPVTKALALFAQE